MSNSNGDTSCSEVSFANQDIYEYWFFLLLALVYCISKGISKVILVLLVQFDSKSSNGFGNLIVVCVGKRTCDVRSEHGNLFSSDLCPACIVSYDCSDRKVVSNHCIKFHDSVADRTVSVNDNNISIRFACLFKIHKIRI